MSGDSHTLSYSEYETRVTDDQGNQISYTEDAQGQILSASKNGNTIKYIYDGSRLTEVLYERGGVTQRRQYHYEAPQDPGLLTGITDERGIRYATWTYDDQGRAISSEHAGGAEKITVAYNADGSSTVTNALGKRTTYRFQTIQGIRRITAIEGEPSANCPNSNATFTYDDRGLVKTRTDNKGHVTTFDYNERGLEVSRTEAYGTPQARTVIREWHPTLFLPVTITEPDRTTRYSYDVQGRLTGQATTQR
ncbi:YD repeat-containing protein [Pseudomonas sp. SLBN-26]|nr:YD repeat-containing protein [Pseudomonas sp. SLBN-26]